MKTALLPALIAVVYLGLLVGWSPSFWSLAVLYIGVSAIAAILLIRQMASGTPLKPSLESILMALMVIWGPIQVVAGLTVNRYETWNQTLYWLMAANVFIVARTLMGEETLSRAPANRFLSIQLWAGSALAVLSVLLFFNSPHKVFLFFPSRYAAYGPFVYKNQFAAFLELIFPIAVYRLVTGQRQRIFYAIACAGLFACMVASLSRAGVAAGVAELVLIPLTGMIRGSVSFRTIRIIGIPLLILVTVFSLVVGWDAIGGRFQERESFAMRGSLARSTIEMIGSRPLTGYGLGTWQSVYPQFAHIDLARLANEAHNDWLQWAADGGVPFALLMLVFVIAISRFVWRNLWAFGVPVVFIHCLVDYPTREPALAALLFLFAGAVAGVSAGGGVRKRASAGKAPEWQVLSVRTATE